MLDHVFTDAIGALRDSLERAFLERQAFEERFQVDVLLGDITWETSYGLPGEGLPPRVQADLTLDWPTWAQTAYRSWYIGEPFNDPPRIEIELVAAGAAAGRGARSRAGAGGAARGERRRSGPSTLERSGPTIETVCSADLDEREYAIEVSYEGSYELDEATLTDGTILDDHLSAMGGWIASTLVKLGDLTLPFLPPVDDDH